MYKNYKYKGGSVIEAFTRNDAYAVLGDKKKTERQAMEELAKTKRHEMI